jgi:hypothetical protein
MVFTAEQTARNAEKDNTNDPGMCLQQCRVWAGINAKYPDASTAWRNANNRHPGDRTSIPRGAAVYWTGGSKGYGHIAISIGKGLVRSTDANGTGRVASRPIAGFDSSWPSLKYAGWADNINEVTIPGADGKKDEDMPLNADDLKKIRAIVSEEVEKRVGDVIPWPTDKNKANKVTVATALSRLKKINERVFNLSEDDGK